MHTLSKQEGRYILANIGREKAVAKLFPGDLDDIPQWEEWRFQEYSSDIKHQGRRLKEGKAADVGVDPVQQGTAGLEQDNRNIATSSNSEVPEGK
ncbi:hypothetical protein AC578_1289 [Pseudocercospora eumusae]|uniref:Uncharacterized protein n=1 Tax=Pseudocercospora eumusae TaxID=321146 RepID=A0A139HUF8_9PEZI|nr:hypothetical protein AC578_1289 [Pseudocercospora eumusae]